MNEVKEQAHTVEQSQPNEQKTVQSFSDAPKASEAVDAAAKEPKKKIKKGWKRELLEWVVAIVGALLIAFLVRTAIFEPVKVLGNSMIDTLQNNEIMIATKYDYLLGVPKRFDIVICKYPGRKEVFVKRIVGLPGDTISVQNGVLSVNGETYAEDYLTHRPDYTIDEYKVPEGQYFVLGDNRSNSNDSHLIGPITRAQIVGHVRCVVFPFNRIRSVEPTAEQIKPISK